MHESMSYDTRSFVNNYQRMLDLVHMAATTVIDRSEIIVAETWLRDPEHSVVYLDIEGDSPPITNHLSDVTYKINWGEGKLVTDVSEMQLQPDTEVTIFKGNVYQYSGEFDAVVEAKPGLNERFVTFNDFKLGKKEAKELKHLQNGYPRHMRAITAMLNMALEAIDLANPDHYRKEGYL